MTFTQYLTQMHAPQTVDSYLRAVNHFLQYSNKKEQSNYADILDYLSSLNSQSSRTLSAIKKYFDYLIETDQRDNHPCKHLTIKRTEKPIQFQTLFTTEELEKLLERESRYKTLQNRNKVIISLLIYQGLSPANIINLRLKDIDLEKGTIYIKSTSKLTRRTLELKSKQSLLFYRYIQEDRKKLNPQTEQLFIGKLSTEITVDTLNKMLRPLKKVYKNRNLNANSIRKSVITNWINEHNISIEDVQLLAGHKWLSTTEKYKRQDNNKSVEMINRFFPI